MAVSKTTKTSQHTENVKEHVSQEKFRTKKAKEDTGISKKFLAKRIMKMIIKSK